MSDLSKYSVDASGATGVVIGDRAQVIQNISHIYNVNSAPEGIRRIRSTLKERLRNLIERQSPFGGRDEELKRLDSLLLAPSGYQFVTGASGFGKTALLGNWLLQLQKHGYAPCYHFISRREGLADEDFAMRNLCQQLILYHELDGELPGSAGELRSLYRQLLLVPPPQGQKLIVILDGLDEALGWTAGPDLFPSPLPEGVYVAFSARALPEKDWVSELGLASTGMEALRVDSMGIKEISDLLKKAGGRALALSTNASFLKSIDTISGGDPFYLHFLVEDIQIGQVTAENIANQPKGLSAYLGGWWEQLADDVELERQEVYDLLGILTVALGPINRQDLAGMSPSLGKGALLKRELSGQLRRYLTGDQDKGYGLCHHRFAEYLAKEVFLPEERREYRKQVVDYCDRWTEHNSCYALSYYPKHLLEAGRLKDLYALIDKPWMNAQFENTGSHRQFVSDVELVFLAAESEKPRNWVQLSRLALVVGTVMEIAGNAPVSALGTLVFVGQDAKAWSYAALQSPLKKPEAYRRIGKAHQLCDQRERAKKALALSLLAATEDMVFFSLQAQAFLAASLLLAELGNHETAITVAELVVEITESQDDSTRSSSIAQAAEVFATAGRSPLLEELVLKADSINEARYKAEAMTRISDAFQTVGEKRRSAELAELAIGAVQGTQPAIELPILADAAELLSKLEDKKPRSAELADTVLTQLEKLSGWERSGVLMNLVLVYARTEDDVALSRVLDNSRVIDDEWRSVLTMCFVAEALAKCSVRVKAHEFAQQALDLTSHPKAKESNPFMLISSAVESLCRASEFDLGRSLAETIVDISARASALGEVATALAEVGDTQNAEKLGAAALSMVETLTPDESKASAFASFSSALEDQGRHDIGREIAHAAIHIAQAIADENRRSDAMVKSYPALKRVGANELADKTAEMVLEIAERSDSLKTSQRCRLAMALASAGDTEGARRVAEIALSGVTESLDGDLRATQLKLVADAMNSAGAVSRAGEIAKEALTCTRSEWFKTNPRQEATTISDLAVIFARIGDTETVLRLVERCLEILEPLESSLSKTWAIGALAEAISTLRSFDKAIEMAKAIEGNPEGRGVILLSVAEVLISSGCEAKAIELIEEAKDVAGRSWWAPNWSEISTLMSLVGRREDALTYLATALRSSKANRHRVLQAMASGSALLATIDHGETLFQIYESVNEVDGWWPAIQ